MQQTTAGPAQHGTGSVTIADIVSLAAERYGERPAARFKRGEDWVEVSYVECPGEQRRMLRGDADFAACFYKKYKVGDKVPAKLMWGPKGDGNYQHKIVGLSDCPKTIDPNDEAAYEVIQDCEPLIVNGVDVGVHCDRTRSKELLKKCPWFRIH